MDNTEELGRAMEMSAARENVNGLAQRMHRMEVEVAKLQKVVAFQSEVIGNLLQNLADAEKDGRV